MSTDTNYTDSSLTLLTGDAATVLRTLPPDHADRIGKPDLLALCEIWRELDFSGPAPTYAEDPVGGQALQ